MYSMELPQDYEETWAYVYQVKNLQIRNLRTVKYIYSLEKTVEILVIFFLRVMEIEVKITNQIVCHVTHGPDNAKTAFFGHSNHGPLKAGFWFENKAKKYAPACALLFM